MPAPSDRFMVVSPEELASGRALPPQMVEDLRLLADIDERSITEIANTLRNEQGVLTEERFSEAISEHVDEDAVNVVMRTIQRIPPEFVQQVIALINRWRQLSETNLQVFPDEVFAELKCNLAILTQEFPSVLLMRKGNRLLRDTGNELAEVAYICDLRPVFDDAHERVEGFVALANLRLRFVRQNGDHDVFELAITEGELHTLMERSQDALDKLRVMKETVASVR